jgi:hypothetical protein
LGSSISRLPLLILLAAARVAFAQQEQAPRTSTSPDSSTARAVDQRVQGQVVRPGATEMVPVPHVLVTLHRVGSDHAAPLDSVRADGSGHYAFTYRRTGDESAIYFVSASYGGIAYFTPPLTDAVVKGENAEIAVYDTTSVPVPIGVRGHHIVVSAVDASSQRSVTEVYELSNDTSVTRIASGSGEDGAVWRAGFPSKATDLRVTQGDIPPAAVAFSSGYVSVFAPIAPGLAQLAFTYTLPASSFPLSIPVQQPTQILEVLVEDPKGSVRGAKLQEKNPVTLERRSFRRFLADDVPVNAVSVIDLPATFQKSIDRRYLAILTVIIGGAMILALATALRRS